MTHRIVTRLGFLAVAAAIVACGSSGDESSPAPAATTPPATNPPPADTSTTPPPPDNGAVSTTYPAVKPDVPQLANRGGKVLTAPVVVTITFDGDTSRDTVEALGDQIGATDYWKAIVGEYGVGPLTSGAANHVREATAPTLPTDPEAAIEAIVEYMQNKLADTATSHWPEPTDQSIYAVYLGGPAAQAVCNDGAGGLHDVMTVKGKEIPFALMLECDDGSAEMTLQDTTISASHEFAEASVDPFPDDNPGWQGVDVDHLSWELFQMGQDENADLCENYGDAYGPFGGATLGTDYVQKQWSNASAAAGHALCVPAASEPYFNVTLLQTEALTVDWKNLEGIPFDPHTKGVPIKVGETRTFQVEFYSDGATAPFDLTAFEFDPFDPNTYELGPTASPTLDVKVDKTSGQNGEKANVTVKVNQSSPYGAAMIVFTATLDGTTHYMPILVGGNAAGAPYAENPFGDPNGGMGQSGSAKAWKRIADRAHDQLAARVGRTFSRLKR